MEIDWDLWLRWRGPDFIPNHPRRHSYDEFFPRRPVPNTRPPRLAASLSFDSSGRIVDAAGVDVLGPGGEVRGAWATAPPQITFPLPGRRRPQVILDQQRRWGRTGDATQPARPTLVVEFQPRLEDAAGAELIRGGDGTLEVKELWLDGARVDRGLIASTTGVTAPPPDMPDADLPTFRVRGLNPPVVDVVALIGAAVQEYFNVNQALGRVGILSLACWRETMVRVVRHESGGRFIHFRLNRRPNARANAAGNSDWWYEASATIRYQDRSYGHESDMPLFGPPHGYGLGQLDNFDNPVRGATADEVWDLVKNVRSAVRVLMHEKGIVAWNHLSPNFPAVPGRRERAVFQREVVRRYNGGREFIWNAATNRFVIRPDSQNTARLLYPNLVLGREGVQPPAGGADAIVYFRNGPAGAANRAANPPANTNFPWPIQFNANHYGPCP